MAQEQVPHHAGVRLDPAALGRVFSDAHEDVEPIPWKTGNVGVVPSIDGPVGAPSPPAHAAHPTRAAQAQEPG
ncbi:MAG: hypothetical protein M3O50_20945, partial [Myxococcota bacterium]|nr:hypothetical protein [Myxococcota bacterium]